MVQIAQCLNRNNDCIVFIFSDYFSNIEMAINTPPDVF